MTDTLWIWLSHAWAALPWFALPAGLLALNCWINNQEGKP